MIFNSTKEKFIFYSFPAFLFCLIPFFLITGPFLSDLSVSLISLLFFVYCSKQKNFSYFKNKYFYIFLIFWFYLIINSLITVIEITANKTVKLSQAVTLADGFKIDFSRPSMENHSNEYVSNYSLIESYAVAGTAAGSNITILSTLLNNTPTIGMYVTCPTNPTKISSSGLGATPANTGVITSVNISGNNTIIGHEAAYPEVRQNTAQAGGTSSITLDASASGSDDAYNGYPIHIRGGAGFGQVRTISDYDGTTKVATVSSAWTTQPDNTSKFSITNF